ncbi:hypothetical protein DPV78_001325 [Talaromyces pinophilus]|nr:hypothetical protein DPV78_001325 [Talaromyces pinophilus]
MAAYGWGYIPISIRFTFWILEELDSIRSADRTNLKLDDSLLKPRTSHSLLSRPLALSPGRRTIGSLQLTILFPLSRLLDEFRIKSTH